MSNVVELSRWQFAITTVYHFLFVPISIGMAGIVAGFQTAWYKTRDPQWMRLTRFFGKIMLLSFAVGVVTGIVQEFQFGMNWAGYSRYVGSVFGAPLAVEALAAFFIESTFLGIWIFGYKRISEGWHLAALDLVAARRVCGELDPLQRIPFYPAVTRPSHAAFHRARIVYAKNAESGRPAEEELRRTSPRTWRFCTRMRRGLTSATLSIMRRCRWDATPNRCRPSAVSPPTCTTSGNGCGPARLRR